MNINFVIPTLTFVLWNCDLQRKTYASYLPSHNVLKFKDRLLQSQVINKPEVTSVYFEENENFTNAIIKVDGANEVLYVLTFLNDKHENLINSSFYYFSISETSITKVDLFFQNESIQFSNIFAFSGLVVAFSPNNIICVSFTNGKEWKELKSSINAKKAYYQSAKNLLAISDEKDSLYFVDAENEHYMKIAVSAHNIKWHPQYGKLYYIADHYLSETSLVYSEPGRGTTSWVGSNVEGYDLYENIVWMFIKVDTNSFQLEVDRKDQYTYFPTYVILDDMLVLHISKKEILIAIMNKTHSCHLFITLTTELKFSKISSALVCNETRGRKFCVEVEVFDAFPGLLVANIKSEFPIPHESFTAISFNHGVKWTYVRGPKEISNHQCAWPNCYLRLNLRCFRDDEKSAIKHDELNPSLMIASGSIYSEKNVKFNGLFVSIDAGYMWKPVLF